MNTTDDPDRRAASLPPETRHLLLFQVCNACNFTIALGAPLILLARFLGASEVYIGALTAIPPLSVGLQLFMTNVIDRVGYREMMLLGWGTRSFMLLLVTPLPFLVGRVDNQWLIWGLFVPVLLFNIIRSLASGAWLPWLRGLLPEHQRGTYFGLEQRVMNVSGFVTLLGCGWFLGTNPAAWKYSILFFIAWAVGMMSVLYLRRAPSIATERQNSQARPLREVFALWRVIWRHKPFRRMTRFVALLNIALASVPAFLVVFLSDELKWTAGEVTKLQSVTTLGVLLTAVFWGRLSDRAGSRPLLSLGLLTQMLVTVWWLFVAADVIEATFWTASAIYFAYGVAGSAMAIAQMRLVLGCSPQGETTLSMAYYQVVVALCAGLSPMLWGILLDAMRHMPWASAAASIPFAIFFAVCGLLAASSFLLLARVHEPKAMSTHQLVVQAIYDWPIKLISGAVLRQRK